MVRLRKLPLWLWYTFIFLVLITVIYGSLYMAGRSLVWNVDGITQHFPILIQFQRILKGIGSQTLFSWSWNLGLGADQMTTFAYYVVGDPFNYLIALFPVTKVEMGYQLLILLRLYVVGLAFLKFASIWNFSRVSRLIGALTYTLTAYTFFTGMHHPFFLLPMIFFPLLIWGIERIFRGQSWWPLAVVTALTVASNVYFTYLLGLGSIIYTLWRYFQLVRQGRIQNQFLIILRKLVSAVIVGILTASVLLVPTAMVMLNSTRTGFQFASGMWLYPLKYYESLPNMLLTNGNGLPFWTILGMGSITFFAILHSFRHFKQNQYLNWLIIGVFIGMLIPAVAAIFNVMTSPSNRWLLMSTLLFAFATMRLIDQLDDLDQIDYRWFVAGSVGLLVVVWVSKGFYLDISRHDAETYAILFLVLVWLIGRSAIKLSRTAYLGGLLMLVCLNIMNNGLGWMSAKQSQQNQQQLMRGAATRWVKSFLDGAEKALPKHSGFYRTSLAQHYYTNTKTPGNDIPMAMGIHNIASYYSVQNSALGSFSNAIGNQVSVVNSPLGNAEQRLTVLNLTGVRYVFERSGQYHAKNWPKSYQTIKNSAGKTKVYKNVPLTDGLSNHTGTVVLKNRNALPLVYTQSNQITTKTFNQLSQVEREQAMLQGTVTDQTVKGVQKVQLVKQSVPVKYHVTMDTHEVIDSSKKYVANRKRQGKTTKATAKTNTLIKANQKLINETKTKNRTGLKQMTSGVAGNNVTYKLVLEHPERYKNAELYLDLSGIQAKYSMMSNVNRQLLNGQSLTSTAKLQNLGNQLHLNNGLSGYKFTATTNNFATDYHQQAPTNLSNYVIRKHVLLNLGYSQGVRKTMTLRLQGVQNLNFKHAKVIAVKYGSSYQKQVKRVQKHGLKQLHVTNNLITGVTNNQRASLLTTSIPYTKGWQLTVDGKRVTTQMVNKGFVGAKVPAGKHRIKLTYRTPGLRLGTSLSILGIILLVGSIVFERWTIKKRR